MTIYYSPRITDRDRRIVAMWLRGEKMDVIGVEIGTSRGAISRRVLSIGLPPRMPGVRALNLFPLIVAWAKQGHSPEAIAAGIGCTRPDIIARIA